MKKKLIIIVLFIVMLAIAVVAYFVHDAIEGGKTVAATTSIEDEKVEVTKLALKEIHRNAFLTSNTYDYTYDYKIGGLEEDAGLMKKTKYALGGRKLTIEAEVEFEMKTDLLNVTKEELSFNEKTGILTLQLAQPIMDVELKDSKKDEENSRQAIFSVGYSEEEMLEIQRDMVIVGKERIEVEKPEDIESAKEDIKSALEGFLLLIPTVKDVQVEYVEDEEV